MTEVRIRPYTLDDVAALYEAARESSAEAYPWLEWCHPGYQVREARDWIAAQMARRDGAIAYHFAIVDGDDRLLGGTGLSGIHRVHRYANLGYWVRSSATGAGVAPRAVRAVARWAFAHTDLERLEILCATGNPRSQRVAEKAGARREGVLRSRLLLHGRHHDAVVYSIVRSDPAPPAPPAPRFHSDRR